MEKSAINSNYFSRPIFSFAHSVIHNFTVPKAPSELSLIQGNPIARSYHHKDLARVVARAASYTYRDILKLRRPLPILPLQPAFAAAPPGCKFNGKATRPRSSGKRQRVRHLSPGRVPSGLFFFSSSSSSIYFFFFLSFFFFFVCYTSESHSFTLYSRRGR
jgi:hypothetical protein